MARLIGVIGINFRDCLWTVRVIEVRVEFGVGLIICKWPEQGVSETTVLYLVYRLHISGHIQYSVIPIISADIVILNLGSYA